MQPRKLHGVVTTATPDSSEEDRKPERALVVVEREVPDLSGAQVSGTRLSQRNTELCSFL